MGPNRSGALLRTDRHGLRSPGIRQQLFHAVHPLLNAPGKPRVYAVLKQFRVGAGWAEHTGQPEVTEFHPADGTLRIRVKTRLERHQTDIGLAQQLQIPGIVAEGMAVRLA